jgi:ATP-dependent Clp protease, protease subunit
MAAPGIPAPAPAHDIFGVFVDDINQANANRIVSSITNVMAQGNKHAHVMFQSWGGFVGDGVMLYNFFRALTLDLSLYNSGQVASAAVIAYLGAKRRVASKSSIFMLHRSRSSPQFVTASKMEKLAETLTIDDKRSEDILKKHIHMPDELWKQLEEHDLYLTGEEAAEFGIATEIGEFAPPPGTQIWKV